VVETERVVRASSRTFSRSSSPFIAWLKAGCDMPSLEAARVKLSSSATTAKAARSFSADNPCVAIRCTRSSRPSLLQRRTKVRVITTFIAKSLPETSGPAGAL
jgi:hypothetical protein